MRYFETRFLEEVDEFLTQLDPKAVKKVLYNIDFAEQTNDMRLFKKLNKNIWEFRTKFGGLSIRLLAFWDTSDNKESLVIATHGIIKKTDKVPAKEIKKAENIRKLYFKDKDI